jgi:hypothetical protein
LDSGDADPACGTVHQDPLTRSEPALGEQGVMRDRERLREPTGLHQIERVRHWQGGAFVDHSQLRLGSASHHGHDPISHDEALDARANCPHSACELEARDVCRRTRRSRVQTGPLQQVGGIHARGSDTDKQFAGPRDRVGPFSHDD